VNDEIAAPRKISVEFVLYACIIIVSLAFRFALLGRAPLNDDEARLAMEAWSSARGGDVLISGQPGYIALTAASFFLFKASTFFARFWPALIGSLTALLPYFFRDRLGKPAAIILAILLAVDPFMISISRSASGSIFALVGLLAGIGFWRLRRPIWSGIAFGLALLGGVDLWPGLIMIGVVYFTLSNPLKSSAASGEENRKPSVKILLISLAVTAAVISTTFLTKPAAISAIGSSLVEYFKSWALPGTTPFYSAFMIWLIVQIPVVVFAIWGLVIGIKEKNPLATFCGIWWGLALLLGILNPSRNLNELFWASVPMLTLAAIALSRLAAQWQPESRIGFLAETAAVVALMVFSFMNFTNLVNSSGMDAENLRNRIIGILLPLVLLAVVTVLFAWGWSASSTRKGLIFGIGLVLFTCWIGSVWKAADLGSRPESEFKYSAGYSIGENNLLKSAGDLSLWSTSQVNRIDVQIVNVDSDALKWALRNFDNLSTEQIFNPHASSSIVITPANYLIEAKDEYRGQNITWSIQPDFADMTLQDWAKWAIFRTAPQKNTDLILWAKNSLFP
jgi:hypothetical protein